MPKYVKLFESFIHEAAGDLLTVVNDTARVKWTTYQQAYKLASKKLGKMMFIIDAKAAKDRKYNLVVMTATAKPDLTGALKQAGGIATQKQSGTLEALPNGEANFGYSAMYVFAITEADGAAKLDSIANLLDGILPSGTAGTAGTSGKPGEPSAVSKIFGTNVEKSFDAAMQKAGVKQSNAYLRLLNEPALQIAASQDASIKTLLDAQAIIPIESKPEWEAKEKEIAQKVQTALTAAIAQEPNPAAKAELQKALAQYQASSGKSVASAK